MARTEAILNANGNATYATGGAVNQHDGSIKIMRCLACYHEVGWCTSSKTGRYYLVNIQQKYNGGSFYMGHDIHKCTGGTK